jgi:hypothetical protein
MMDNLRAHKVADVREAIEAAGDLNPLETPMLAPCRLSGEQFDPSSRGSTLGNEPTIFSIEGIVSI